MKSFHVLITPIKMVSLLPVHSLYSGEELGTSTDMGMCCCTDLYMIFSPCSGDGGAVAYALVSGSDRKFEVDVSTGLVTTVDYLDYETKTSYLMNVSATDQAPPFHQGFCSVYVTLLNELDEAVAFSSAGYEASLRENIATGTEVIQVQAQSADNLNQLTYRFDPDTSPAALALFKIDSVTVRGDSILPFCPRCSFYETAGDTAALFLLLFLLSVFILSLSSLYSTFNMCCVMLTEVEMNKCVCVCGGSFRVVSR